MRRLVQIVTIGAVFVAVVFSALQILYPTYVYRYRIKVEANGDGQPRIGSGVIEVRLNRQPTFLLGMVPGRADIFGDAIFLDLGRERYVIALLASGRGTNVNFPAFVVPDRFGLSYDDRDLPKYPNLQGRWELDWRTLPESRLPSLITFSDLNNPVTARLVAPSDFAKEFGPDVTPPRITVEMTTDPVTRGIDAKLPWWNRQGRPAAMAYHAFSATEKTGSSIGPETVFRRN